MISLVINLVVWAESRELAEYLTSNITRGEKVNANIDIYQTKVEYPDEEKEIDYLIDLRGYFRWPKSYIRSIPEGITDILIVNLSSMNSEYYEEARKYLNMRRGIPFKFLTSSEDMRKLADELDCEFILEEDLTTDETLKNLIDSAMDLDYTLRSVFEKIDYDEDGYIQHQELFKISKDLAYKMTEEEVKEIAFTLSKNGCITYHKFKKWWIMGRHDFLSFRRIINLEFTLNNFITHSNSYLEKLKFEVQEISKTSLRNEGKIEITSDEEGKLDHKQKDIIYRDYTNIILKFVNGIEVDLFIDSLPDYLRICPLSFGIELNLKAAVDGPIVLFSLQHFKNSLYTLPYIKELLIQGLVINFRHIDTNIFVDFSISPNLLHDLLGNILNTEFNFLNNVGSANLHLISALRIQDLLDITFKNFIEKLSLFKIDYHGEFSNLKYFLRIINDIIMKYFDDKIDDKIYRLLNILDLVGNVSKFKFDVKYDSKGTAETIKEIFSKNIIKRLHLAEQVGPKEKAMEKGYNKAEEEFKLFQKKLNDLEKTYRPLVIKYIQPYMEALKMINFDKFYTYLLIPGMRSFIKLGLCLFGINRYMSQRYFK